MEKNSLFRNTVMLESWKPLTENIYGYQKVTTMLMKTMGVILDPQSKMGRL